MTGNTLDLIINLVVKNQDAVRSLQENLKAIGSVQPPNFGNIADQLSGLAETIKSLTDVGPAVEQFSRLSAIAIPELPTASVEQLELSLGTAAEEAKNLGEDLNIPVDGIQSAVDAIAPLQAVDLTIDSQLQDVVDVAADLENIEFPSIPTEDVAALAEALGLSAEAAQTLQAELNLPSDAIEEVVRSLKQFDDVDLPVDEQFEQLNSRLGITREQFDRLRSAVDQTSGGIQGGLGRLFNSVAQVAFGFNQITQAVQTLASTARPAYEYLIGANEKLNQQMLQSAATIVATSKVENAGGKLDNLDAIRALQPKLKASIKEVELATMSLVGVTSQQTSEVFNVILANTGQLNGQLKSAATQAEKFKDPLDAAAKLAPGLVATLGTIGLPMAQAAQEVGSLLKGEIDQSAQVAKSLGITRQMIESWKAQGVLVDKLTQKFDPFIKANGEAAKSVGGITSNIQDMFEIMGREAGKPLAIGFVDGLQAAYEVIQKVMPAVQAVFTEVIARSVNVAGVIGTTLTPIANGIGASIASIGPSIGPVVLAIVSGIGTLVSTLAPVANLIGTTIGSIGTTIGALLPAVVQLGQTLLSAFSGVVSVVVGALQPAFFVVAEGIKLVAGAIQAIAGNPLGNIILQSGLLTAAFAAITPAILAAVPAIATLSIVALDLLPLGPAIASAFGLASTAAVGFFAKVAAGFAANGIAGSLSVVSSSIAALATSIAASATAAFGRIALMSGVVGKELLTLAATAIPRAIAAFAALNAGGVAAGFAALTAGLPTLAGGLAVVTGAAATATAAMAPLLLAIAPFLALGGVIAIGLAFKGAKDASDTKKALDDVEKSTKKITEAATETTKKLKEMAELSAKGLITTEQKEDQKKSIEGAKAELALMDKKIEAIKKTKEERGNNGAKPEDLTKFDQQVEKLEKSKEALSGYANAVKLASQDLPVLGTASDQIAAKVKAASNILANAAGDPAKYTESAKLVTSLIQKQVELKTITTEEAAKTLSTIQNNTKLDYESQLAAKEAIVKLYQDRFNKIEELMSVGKVTNTAALAELEQVRSNTELEIKIRQDASKKIIEIKKQSTEADLAELGAQNAIVESKKAQGIIGESEAAKQISEIKIKESRRRIDQQKEELNAELNPERRRKLEAEVQKSEAEITRIEAEEQNRRNAQRLKSFDNKIAILKGEYEKGNVPQEEFNKKQLALDLARSAEEVSQLRVKFSKIQATDKDGREALEAQIAAAESAAEAARKASNDRTVAIIEQGYKKTLDIARNGELQKSLELEKAILAGSKTREQANTEAAQSSIQTAEQQFQAEADKLEKLKNLIPLKNPADQAAQEGRFREQQNKSLESELTLTKKRVEAKNAAAEVSKAAEKASADAAKAEADAVKSAADAEKAALAEKVKGINDLAESRSTKAKNQQLDEQLALERASIEGYKRRGDESEKSTRKRVAAELVAEKEKYRSLAALAPLNDPKEEFDRQETLAKVRGALIQKELESLQAIKAEKLKQIEIDSNAALVPLQKKLTLLELQKTLLSQQNDLIASQQKVEGAAFNLAKQRLGFAIEEAKESKNDALVKRLEVQAASENLEFVKQQNVSKIESLRLSQEQKAIDISIQAIQAQIASLNAQANLQKAVAEGKPKTELEALEREVSLRTKQETLLDKALANQDKLNKRELGATKLENRSAEESAQRGLDKAIGRPTAIGKLGYRAGETSSEFDKTEGKPEVKASVAADRLANSLTRLDKQLDPNQGKLGPDGKPVRKASDQAGKPPAEIIPPKDPVRPPTAKGKDEGDGMIRLNASAGSFAKTLTTAANSASKALEGFALSAGNVSKLPKRFAGGPVEANQTFIGAELGPELAKHTDGTFSLLQTPGIYNLDRAANIITANETQSLIQNADNSVGSTISHVAIGARSSTMTNVGIGGDAIVAELRHLRSIVSSRKPEMNLPVSFTGPIDGGVDKEFAKLSRMLIRSSLI